MQSNRWLCGSSEYPIAAIIHSTSGRELELYKASSSNDSLSSFIYIPIYDGTSETLEVSDQIYEAFIYYAAGLTLTTFREELSENMFAIAKGLLNME